MVDQPAFQPGAFQQDAFQSGVQVVAAPYSLSALDFGTATVAVNVHANAYSLGSLDFGTVHAYTVQLVGAADYSLGALSFDTPPSIQKHVLSAHDYTLSLAFSPAPWTQNHFLTTNNMDLESLAFDFPTARENHQVAAAAFDLGSLAFDSIPASVVGQRVTADDYTLDRLRFGFPRLIETQRFSSVPPLYIERIANAAAILDGMLNRILAAVPAGSSTNIPTTNRDFRNRDDLRHLVATTRAKAEELIREASLGQPLTNIFNLAWSIRANLDGVDAARRFLMAQKITSDYDMAVIAEGIVMCLALESRLITDMTFKSREDVRTMITRARGMFDDAKELGIDDLDAASYRTLNSLGGSLINHLAKRELQLPRIVDYRVATVMPSLALANLIYGDASRSDEIEDENRIIHPAFCGMDLKVLSD